MAHSFFTSYASLDNPTKDGDGDGPLGRVVKEIRERVRAKLGDSAADEVGFVAQNSIQSGDDWRRALGEALCRSRVLVCFCSPSFFASPWCAREFAVFRERLRRAPGGFGARVIVPVIWEPARVSRPMPAAVSQYQFTDDRFPPRYAQNGLFTLSRLKAREDDYFSTVDLVAETICGALEEQELLPVIQELPPFETLPRTFDNPGPYSVAIAILHSEGPQWRPEPLRENLGAVVDRVCTKLQVPWRELPLTIETAAAELKKASDGKEAVVLVSDEASLCAPPWSQVLGVVDGVALQRCAVVYGRLQGTPLPADSSLRPLLPRTAQVGELHGPFELGSNESLRKRMEELIAKLRLAVIHDTPPTLRVESEELAAAAAANGIAIATVPAIAGPGSDAS